MQADPNLTSSIAANWRLAHEPVTGVTRCATEILRRFPAGVQTLSPSRRMAGLAGQAWEQALLPGLAGNKLLWNPNCTGPLFSRRQVITVHDLAPLDHPEWFGQRFARWYQFLLPRLAERALAVICVSEFSRRRLLARTGVRADRTCVIPNGIDDRFRPVQRDTARQKLATLHLAPRFVLTLGSIEPRKNLTRLLAAWALAQKHVHPDVSLVIAGGAGARHIFSQSTLDLLPPRVQMLGRVDDELLPALYSAADVFVYPSLYEGFGLPPLEAMACGTPVIASAIDAIQETTEGAVTLVDPNSTSELAQALVRILNNPESVANSTECAKRTALKYSWAATAERTWRLLERLA
jgi:glycosyltransferase involved in cell wall biosynthesis